MLVALHTYAIATQATNRFLWQDSHLLVTEQLSVHSEGDVVVGNSLIGVMLVAGGRSCLPITARVASRVASVIAMAGSAEVAATAEQTQLVNQNLGAILLLARFFVIPGTGLDLAFDEELSPFLHVVANDLCRAVECDEVVPFSLVSPVAVAVLLPV